MYKTIRIDGDPILTQIAQPVVNVAAEQRLVSNMLLLLTIDEEAVGLAAPQVGESKRIIVIRKGNALVPMINPIITGKFGGVEAANESCLSIPGKIVVVKRHRMVMLRYTDRRGNSQTLRARGKTARVIQHEVDHLDGILIGGR